MKTPDALSWKLKITLLLVSSLTIMSVITISPSLPQMAVAFSGEDHADFLVKLVLTIPALMIAVISPVTGKLIDRYGRLSILKLSVVLYALCGTAGFYLQDLYAILVSRALLGVSVGISMPVVITLIADYFEGAQRQKFVGIQVAFMSLGGILFISTGGILADYGWRFPFLLYVFSLFILPLINMFLYEPAVVQHTTQMSEQAKSPSVIWLLFVNTMIMWILFFLIPVQIPFYLKAIGVERSSLAGAAIGMSTGFSALSSFSYSRLKTRFNFLFIFSMGYFLMAAGFACISLSHTYLPVVAAMMLTGLGMGMMIPNTNIWVMKIAPASIRGKEIGKLTTFWFFGQFISPLLFFPLLSRVSLSTAFLLSAVFLFVLSAGFLFFYISKEGKVLTASAEPSV